MRIIVPSGIGDFSWIYAKLSTLHTMLDVAVVRGGYRRLLPYLEILPYVENRSETEERYAHLLPVSMPWYTTKEQLLEAGKQAPLAIAANQHLEAGNDLESWLPDIECDYHYAINALPEHRKQASAAMEGIERYHVIFTASLDSRAIWHGWTAEDWMTYIKEFDKLHGEVTPVLVGAEWDLKVCNMLEAQIIASGRKCRNLCAKLHIGATLEVMKKAIYVAAFPSGIAITANVINAPAMMFWPKSLEAMMHSFADPADIESGRFVETLFIDPVEAVKLTKVRGE